MFSGCWAKAYEEQHKRRQVIKEDIPYLRDMECLMSLAIIIFIKTLDMSEDYYLPSLEGHYYHIYNRAYNGDRIFYQHRNFNTTQCIANFLNTERVNGRSGTYP